VNQHATRDGGGRHLRAVSDRLHKLAGKVFDKLGLSPSLRNKVHRSICAVTGHPVDIATGKLFTEFVDLRLGGPFPFALERVWHSTSTYQGPFGHGWHASFDVGLAVDEKVVGVRLADGRVALFPPLADGASHYDARERLTLAREGYGYALSDAQGLTYRFVTVAGRPDQALGSIVDRNGFALRFEYGGPSGSLKTIRDAAGRAWQFDHDGTGRIATINGPHASDPAQRTTYMQYSYDAQGNLVEARDALGAAQRGSTRVRIRLGWRGAGHSTPTRGLQRSGLTHLAWLRAKR
jgi:YD repeat-containing protein